MSAPSRAEIHLTTFSSTPGGNLATGTLKVKSIEAPIEVPFIFKEDANGVARVSGTAGIDRLNYKLGVGNEAKGE